ncbi:MAG: NAD-dependent epimerase/dehydratase family protein [Candidatus Paceibacterota bacterium]|jgi:dTDP-glucose 4,6-dehydratase
MENKKTRVLLTGGAGFIGHHVLEGILKETDWEIVVLDRLDLPGSLERLRDIEVWEANKHRVKFVWWDLKSQMNQYVSKDIGEIDHVWHLAANSHVDRSIKDPALFVMDNVLGTTNLLLWAKDRQLKKFIYFSTDEVFGPAPKGVFYKEWDRYRSCNPYAASKAGAEEMCLAFCNTYGLPIVITHTMNVFGERQHPEKFIPMTVKKILNGDKVLIHGDPEKKIPGSRLWIHARNVCQALLFINENGTVGEKYNIVGEKEVDNLAMARFIAKTLGKKLEYEFMDFHSSRPGHDLRYSLDGSLLKEMGFSYPKDFEASLEKTIKWMVDPKNIKWLVV